MFTNNDVQYKLSFMIFRTGSILIVGKCSEYILNYVYNYIKDIFEKGEYIFNGVPQTFFYYSIESTLEEFDPNEFERVVPNR